MSDMTLGQVAYEAKVPREPGLWWLEAQWLRDEYERMADSVVASHEARRWMKWPDEHGNGEYPPDKTPVLIYCGNWNTKEFVVGGICRSRGMFGPSGATHWTPIPAPPKEAEHAE